MTKKIIKKRNLNISKCDKCGGMMHKAMIDYEESFYNQVIKINSVSGYLCGRCGNKTIDKAITNYINKIIQNEELKNKKYEQLEYIMVNKLKRVRMKKGLSQHEMAELLGVTHQRYGAIERNTNTPTILTEHLLAIYLNSKPTDLYEMKAIPIETFNKIKDLEIIENSDESFQFHHVPSVAAAREELNNLRIELQKLNIEKRAYKFILDKVNEEKPSLLKRIKEIEERIEEVKLIKDGKDKKSGLEEKVRKLESNHTLIFKQGKVIDIDYWEKLCTTYKEELAEHSN